MGCASFPFPLLINLFGQRRAGRPPAGLEVGEGGSRTEWQMMRRLRPGMRQTREGTTALNQLRPGRLESR